MLSEENFNTISREEEQKETGNIEKKTGDNQNNLIEELTNKIESLESKVEENWDLYLRSKAEAANILARAKRDIESAHKYGQERLALKLLNVVDSLETGLLHSNKNSSSESDDNILQGIRLTYKMLLSTLEDFGIKRIDPLNQEFDPKYHEALSTQPASDGQEKNRVITVIQSGFTYNDRILRPARVIVSC